MLSFLKRSENGREHRVVRLARLPDINRALQVAVRLSKKKKKVKTLIFIKYHHQLLSVTIS